MGARPPYDHPHVYLDMGSETQILCPYCSTLYVHDERLNADETEPRGCIASLDHDVSARGCGARVQASSACADAACSACQPYEKFIECRRKAYTTVCRTHYLDSVCQFRPEYATCTDYETNEQYFRSVVNLFCGTGSPNTLANAAGAVR